MDILIICLRTIVSYFILILALRVMGKREIGQLNLFDLIILLSLADIMIIGIENYDEKWTHVIVPVVLLTIIQKIIAKVLLKSSKVRTLIDGKPSFIIIDGKLCIKEMKKQSYNMEDLLFTYLDNPNNFYPNVYGYRKMANNIWIKMSKNEKTLEK